ncbi:hypothetical protein [uncultured Roseibium sp.]|uniref:hypothetical protein n=1 Tax=uncultured Roseibium sp. TaxID=1936171 RepID=UPI002637DA09|nr:hypothetical protein [uncultured Roseibium sp.]
MADNTEKLVLLLEAQNKDVLRKLNQMERQSRKSFGSLEKHAKGFRGEMHKATGAVKGFVSAFAGGLLAGGFAGLAAGAAQAAESIASIGDAAQRAGLDVRSFQELGYVAEQNRIPVDALTDGMKELNLRADEFVVTGKGPAAEAFQRLGFTANELKEALKNPSELLIDIIARLQELDTAAQIRVADELFGGTAGERFVELLDLGADGIRDMISEAHEFGFVMDEEMIQKAADVDREFKALAKTISTNVKGALVSAADELSYMLKLLDSVENRQEGAIRRQIAEKQQALIDAEGKTLFGFGSETFQANIQADIDRLQKELLRRQIDRGPTVVPTRDTFLRSNRSGGGGDGGGSGEDSTRTKQVRDYTRSLEDANKTQRDLNSTTSSFQSVASSAFGVITSQINTGNAALDRFLSTLIETGAQAAFLGQGPLAGLFGGGGGGLLGGVGKLFGGFFADGGHLGAGKYGIAGEAGPELIKGPANVVPMSKAGGSTTTIVKVVPSDMFDVIVDGKAQQAAATGYAMAANDMSRNFSSYQQRNQVNKGT